MTPTTVVLIVVAVVVLLPVLWLVVAYNRFVTQRNLIQSSWSGIDVELTRRHDLIPNLVSTVQGYATHERETLAALVAAREQALPLEGQTPAGRENAESALGTALSTVLVRAEAYPDLKASANFLQLQAELSTTENRIAASRRFYNNNVAAFNARCATFPSNLVAGWFNFTPAEQFTLRDPSVAALPDVSFHTPAAPALGTSPAGAPLPPAPEQQTPAQPTAPAADPTGTPPPPVA